MSDLKPSLGPSTKTVRAGVATDAHHGAVIPPIHLSSTFTFEELGVPRRFDYTRSGNPTREGLARALADLEEGAGAVITSSGMSAITTALHLIRPGGRVVAPVDAYGGTIRLLTAMARRGSIQLELIETWEPTKLGRALSQPTDLLWIETPSNPLLRVTDIAEAASLGHDAGALVVVDNTFLSPALQTPLRLGADLVVHSTTKYLNGHSDVVGGALVARDEAVAEDAAWWANALGVTGAPFDSFLTLRGLRTLHCRMRAHIESTDAVVEVLTKHPAVSRVHWPGLPHHAGFELAQTQQAAPGAIVSFELNQGLHGVERLTRRLRHFSLAESLGGVESLVCHPATMTHVTLNDEQRQRAGICDGLVRLSVGIERPEDLAADLSSGLDAALETSDLSVPAI